MTTPPYPPVALMARLAPATDVRRALINDGFAYLPGLLPPEEVLAVRDAFVSFAAEQGWLATGEAADEARPSASIVDEREPDLYRPYYRRVQACEAFHALGQSPPVLALVEEALQRPAFGLPLKMSRLRTPAGPPSNVHQDHYFLQGSVDTLTAWVPLGDCPVSDGPLAVLARSHRLGLWGADWFETGAESLVWHSGDFGPGDVLLFHSLTMHASLPNRSPRIRFSADFRYQPVGDPVQPASLEPHYEVGSWVDLYEAWESDEHQWYWRRLPLAIRPRVEEISRLAGCGRASRLLEEVETESGAYESQSSAAGDVGRRS